MTCIVYSTGVIIIIIAVIIILAPCQIGININFNGVGRKYIGVALYNIHTSC